MAIIFRAPLLTPPIKARPVTADVFPNLLLSTLAVAAAVAPFKQTDWPTPARRPALNVEVSPNVTLRISAVTPPQIKALDFGTPTRARTALVPDVVPNVLLQLAPPNLVNLPPGDQITDNPATRARYLAADAIANWLAANPPAPFFAGDAAQPTRARAVLAADQAPNLLVSTLAAAAAVLPPGDAWFETPAPRARQPRFDEFPNVALLLPTIAGAPFGLDEWPNPTPRARATPYAETGPNTVLAGIPPVLPLAPFGLDDWPQSSRPRAIHHDVGGWNALVLSTALQPFNQDDWPISVRARWTPVVDAPNSIILATLVSVPPFNQDDWPTPIRARAIAIDNPPNLQGSTLRSFPPVLPFSLKDWPNPVRARHGDQNVVVEDGLIFILPPPAVTAFGSAFWRVYAPARSFTVKAQVRNFTVLAPARTFKVTSDMPTARTNQMDPSEAVRLLIDFTQAIATYPVQGLTVSSIVSTTIAVIFGTDPGPALVLNGAASILPGGLQVYVPIKGGLAGCDYSIRLVVQTSDAQTILEQTVIVSVRS